MDFTFINETKTISGITVYTSPLLSHYGIIHGFPTRQGGVSQGMYASLNFTTNTGDSPETVKDNVVRFLQVMDATPSCSVFSHQVHGNHVARVGADFSGFTPNAYGVWNANFPCDGLSTSLPGISLLTASADCSLIFLYDPRTHQIAALHAGWRGAALDIAGKGVEALSEAGAAPRDMVAFLPPAIGSCCFETDPDVPQAMHNAFGTAIDPYIAEVSPNRYRVALQRINAHALARRGVLPHNIEICEVCSCCHHEFFSHRRDSTKRGLTRALIRMPL